MLILAPHHPLMHIYTHTHAQNRTSRPLVCVGAGEDGAACEALVEVWDGLSGVGTVTALIQGSGQPSICVARRQVCNVY